MPSKKKAKNAYVPALEYSVGRFLVLYYQNERLSWPRYIAMGIDKNAYSTIKALFEPPLLNTPTGVFGGPVPDIGIARYNAVKFVTQLLSRNLDEFDPEDVKLRVRYHVLCNGVITVDEPPKAMGGGLDYSKNQGYKTFERAQVAAEEFFNHYSAFCKNDKNQPSQPVRLILADKDNNLTKKTNGYKSSTKD